MGPADRLCKMLSTVDEAMMNIGIAYQIIRAQRAEPLSIPAHLASAYLYGWQSLSMLIWLK